MKQPLQTGTRFAPLAAALLLSLTLGGCMSLGSSIIYSLVFFPGFALVIIAVIAFFWIISKLGGKS
jgi:protein-S-isoprenylcysteine O-methyltransferase Ste14